MMGVDEAQYPETAIPLLSIAVMLVLTKAMVMRIYRHAAGNDDLALVAAVLGLVAAGVLGYEAYQHRIDIHGYYYWEMFYWEYIYYTVCFIPLSCSKLAFLLAYTRLFKTQRMRDTIHLSAGFFAACGIVFVTATALINEQICESPEVSDKSLRYHTDFTALHYAWAVIDVLGNVWICVLPAIGLGKLRIATDKGVVVLGLLFAVPSIPAAFGIVRLDYLARAFNERVPLAWHTETVTIYWSLLQAAVAVMTATLSCLACSILSPLCRRKAPRSARSTSPTTDMDRAQHRETAGQGTFAFPDFGASEPPQSIPLANRSSGNPLHRWNGLFRRARLPDHTYTEEHVHSPLSGIVITTTIDVVETREEEEEEKPKTFVGLYRKYLGRGD